MSAISLLELEKWMEGVKHLSKHGFRNQMRQIAAQEKKTHRANLKGHKSSDNIPWEKTGQPFFPEKGDIGPINESPIRFTVLKSTRQVKKAKRIMKRLPL